MKVRELPPVTSKQLTKATVLAAMEITAAGLLWGRWLRDRRRAG